MSDEVGVKIMEKRVIERRAKIEFVHKRGELGIRVVSRSVVKGRVSISIYWL